MTLKTMTAAAAVLALSAAAHAQEAATPTEPVDPAAAETYGIVVMAPEGTDPQALADELRRLADAATRGTEEPALATGGTDELADGMSRSLDAEAEAELTEMGGIPGVGPEATGGAAETAEGETQRGADLVELAREADGATLGATDPMGAETAEMAPTQVSPDLEELARQADGALIGATEGAGMGADVMRTMARLEGFGEAFYERGFRQGYVEGLRAAQAIETRQQAMNDQRVRAAREARMRQIAQQIEAEQRERLNLARQQAEMGGGMPRFIVVPQGTDVSALMRRLQGMNQGG